jgi:arylsulfatase
MYDGLAIMPIGQQLWLEQLETYQKFPPLQAPASYNLSQVLQEVKSQGHPSD